MSGNLLFKKEFPRQNICDDEYLPTTKKCSLKKECNLLKQNKYSSHSCWNLFFKEAVILKISKYSQEYICVLQSLFNKVAGLQANFEKHLRMAASGWIWIFFQKISCNLNTPFHGRTYLVEP